MTDIEGASVASWPCILSCISSTIILFLAIRTGYIMGTGAKDKEKKAVTLNTYWGACATVLLLSCLFTVIKFVD